TNRTRSTPRSVHTAAYSRATPRVRSRASGASLPVRSTPWPSRTTSIRRTTSVSTPPETSATSSRMELVPQSMAATRVMASACHPPVTAGTAGASAGADVRPPHRAQQLQRLVAQGVDPGPRGQRVPDEDVQALDPVRHSTGRDPLDLRHLAELGPVGEVGLVRPAVGRHQLRVLREARGHLAHEATG